MIRRFPIRLPDGIIVWQMAGTSSQALRAVRQKLQAAGLQADADGAITISDEEAEAASKTYLRRGGETFLALADLLKFSRGYAARLLTGGHAACAAHNADVSKLKQMATPRIIATAKAYLTMEDRRIKARYSEWAGPEGRLP